MYDFELTRRRLIGAVAALAVAGCAHSRVEALAAGEMEEVIRRHTAARGGADALDRVRSCLIHLRIDEGGQTLQGRYAAQAGGLVRIDIYAEGALVYSEGVDDEGVWLWPRSEAAPRPSAATGAANALLNGAEGHLFGLHRYEERGHRMRMMPAQVIDGVAYRVLEVVFTTGHTSYLYVDPASWLVVRRRDERAYHPDVSEVRQRVETRFSDFQRVEGVLYAQRNVDVDLATGNVLASNQVTRREINPPLPRGVFARAYEPPPRLS